MELVFDILRCETDNIIVIQFGICGKHTVGLDLLLSMRDQQVPIFIDLVHAAQAKALIGDIIDVILDNVAVVCVNEIDTRQISACLEALALGTHGHAIATHSAFGTEPGGVAYRQCAADIVDIATLSITIDDPTQRQLVIDGHIDHGLDTVAHLTAIGERGGRIEPGIKATEGRLVGNHADRTGLRA